MGGFIRNNKPFFSWGVFSPPHTDEPEYRDKNVHTGVSCMGHRWVTGFPGTRFAKYYRDKKPKQFTNVLWQVSHGAN